MLSIVFLSSGLQIGSSGSDGLVKLWNVKDGACVNTMDNHTDKIWALETNSDESLLVSGSSDSNITVWKDVTALRIEQDEKAKVETMVHKQDLEIFESKGEYGNALLLALYLDSPFKILTILKKVYTSCDQDTQLNVNTVLATLSQADV